MHAAFARDAFTPGGQTGGGEAGFRASFPPVPATAAMAAPRADAPRYGERDRANWAVIGGIVLVHAGLLFALVKMDVIEIGRPKPGPLVVDLIAEPPAPPPPAQPEPEVAVIKPVQPRIVAPPPIVATPAVPPQVAVVIERAPPPQAAIVAPAAPKAVAVAAPVAVDLSAKMVSGKPPRYPIESRRKREQGTVVLRLLLTLDGGVDDIAVARTSGFDRLDKAALDAVRRWRWSPTMQAGVAVQVRGMVEIPFVLQG